MGHKVRILDRVKAPEDRIWYAIATIQHGWSRASGRPRRQGKAVANFARRLPRTLPAPLPEKLKEAC